MAVAHDVRAFAYETLMPLDEPRAPEDRDVSSVLGRERRLAPDDRVRAHQVAARRVAMQLLFELDQTLGLDAPAGPRASADVREIENRVLARLDDLDDLGPVLRERVEGLVRSAWALRAEADARMTELAPAWPAHRQPGVDRAILRLADFEVRSGLTPPSIAINEAVELAKRFSTEKSPPFVNGLLGKIERAMRTPAGV